MKKITVRLLILVMATILLTGCTGYEKYNYDLTDQQGNGIYHSLEHKKKTIDKYEGYLKDLSTLPVSFKYDGKSYKGLKTGLFAPFSEKSRETVAEGNKISTKIVLDFKDDIEVTVDMAVYPDHCAYEWTLYFENKGDSTTGLLEELKVADIIFEGDKPVLKGIYGDGGIDGGCPYAPYEYDLTNYTQLHMTPPTGRSTYNYFPYFNMEYGENGTFAAIGWPIMWGATFEEVTDKDVGGLHFEAGQEYFATKLKEGERIRTPLIAFLDYEGRDEARAMNLWRHWFIDCNLRKIEGELFEPNLSGGTSWMYGEMVNATDENQIAGIQKYIDNNVPITYWWMDAGWYFDYGDTSLTVWLPTGTWMVDTKRFPSKFKDISDFGAQYGIKTLLWFEPEVVRLEKFLRDEENGIPQEYMLDDTLANMGDPDFVDWMVNRVSQIITEGGISLYRQDYGINPAGNFHSQNKTDRVGIVENLYAQGYYSYWDKLIEKFPNMMIDSCAAGGGRNDIESMRRAVPLHKTDHNYDSQEDKQSMHQTLFMWLPYFGSCLTGPGTNSVADPYIMRSNYAPWIASGWNLNSPQLDWEIVSEYSHEWTRINKHFYSDYYQLTQWSRGTTGWRGWEFFSPSTNEGFFQLFRPGDAEDSVYNVKLKGLDKDLSYNITNVDTGEVINASGEALMNDGIDVELPQPRSTALFLIAKG